MDPEQLASITPCTYEQIALNAKKICSYTDKFNQSPFCALALKKDLNNDEMRSLCELFFQNGADPLKVDVYGQNAIFYASREGSIVMLKFLLEKGANANHVDNEQQSAIFYASREGKTEVIKLLAESGCDVNKTDKIGQTAIFYAAKHGHIDAIRELIALGADAKHKDLQKRTPASTAKAFRQKDALQHLNLTFSTKKPSPSPKPPVNPNAIVRIRRRSAPIPRRPYNLKIRVVPPVGSTGRSALLNGLFTSILSLPTSLGGVALGSGPQYGNVASNNGGGSSQAGVGNTSSNSGHVPMWVDVTSSCLTSLSEVPVIKYHSLPTL